jgi:hypothetical protein
MGAQSEEQLSDYDFVFAPSPDMGGGSRWQWLAGGPQGGPIGDIRTYLDGMEYCYPRRAELEALDGISRGGGNLGAPIVLMAYLELLARLYVGAEEVDPPEYNATQNVKRFVRGFFPCPSRQIPWALWHGTRNGLVHTFRPKPLTCEGVDVRFRFVQHGESCLRRVTESVAEVVVSVSELFGVIRRAADAYGRKLRADPSLQALFRKAWTALDKQTPPPVTGQFAGLLRGIAVGEHLCLFESQPQSPVGRDYEGVPPDVVCETSSHELAPAPPGLVNQGTASRYGPLPSDWPTSFRLEERQ